MFAFAIWDAHKRRIMAARDRFGVKPLYYTEHEGRLILGSELKVVLAAGVPRRVDPQAVVEYFTFQNMFSDRTLFAGVHALPAGSLLSADADGVAGAALVGLRVRPRRLALAGVVGRRGARALRGGRRPPAHRPTCRSAAISPVASTPARSSRSRHSARRG